MARLLNLAVIFVMISMGYCSSCTNPEITSETFTTQDATIVTSIAYVSEFQVKCKTGTATNLYADIEGSIVPVSVVGQGLYQVSLQLFIEQKVRKFGAFRLVGPKIQKLLPEVIKSFVFLMKMVLL